MRAVEVFGEVELATPAGRARLTGRGDRVLLDLESLAVARALARSPLTAGRAARRRQTHRLGAALERAGVDLDVRVRGRRVGSAGPGTRRGWLSRLLGLGAGRLYPVAIARALARG